MIFMKIAIQHIVAHIQKSCRRGSSIFLIQIFPVKCSNQRASITKNSHNVFGLYRHEGLKMKCITVSTLLCNWPTHHITSWYGAKSTVTYGK